MGPRSKRRAPRPAHGGLRAAGRLHDLVVHLAQGEDWDELWNQLEHTNLLADQARTLGGFEQSARDVENFALPAAVETRDWPRFLRYSLLVLNLRRVAEGLADEIILRALARAGQVEWARDAAARLDDPLARILAHAAIAAELDEAHDRRGELLHRLRDDAEQLGPADRDSRPARRIATLEAVLRALPLELGALLPVWRVKVEHAARPRLAAAYAAGCVARAATSDGPFWAALNEAARAGLLGDLPERLGARDRPDGVMALAHRVRETVAGAAGRLAAARLLNAAAVRAPAPAVEAWDNVVAAAPAGATLEVLAASGRVLAAWDTARLRSWCASTDDPLARATLLVAALEAGAPTAFASGAAWDALRAVPDGSARLNLVLRALTVAPRGDDAERRRRVSSVGEYLEARSYTVDAGDLARYLDLVARHLPADLASEVAAIAWAPGMKGETLLALIGAARAPAVPGQFLKRAESYAAAVAPTEGAGFRLRAEMLGTIVTRLCQLTGDLSHLHGALERLLPEEEDALRFDLAGRLARGEDGLPARTALALDAAHGIRDRRLRLLARLPLLPREQLSTQVGPRRLYAALADSRPVSDELRALVALLRRPSEAPDDVERPLGGLRDEALRVRAHLRLARHRLAYERSAFGHLADLEAPVERLRPALGVESETTLARLVPEIAEIGALARPKAAQAELEEAARTLAELKDVPWSVRREGLERLLGRLGRVLGVSAGHAAEPPMPSRRRSLVSVCRQRADAHAQRRRRRQAQAVLRLVLRLRFPAADALPMVVATAERLGVRDERLDEALGAALDEARRLGGDATTELDALAAVCRGGRIRDGDALSPPLVASAVRVRAGGGEAPAPEWIRALEPGARDALLEGLVVDGWLAPTTSEALLPHFTSPAARATAELALATAASGEPAGAERTLAALATLLAESDFDPAGPRADEVLTRVAELPPALGREALARAVVQALAQGGRARGERALRVWLHAHLGPRAGFYRAGAPQRVRAAREQLRLAARLPRAPTAGRAGTA